MSDRIIALAKELGSKAKKNHITLCTAESCTGGGVAQAITEIPGSSAWFDRSFVTYSNRAKQDMLSVKQSTLETDGAVSEATAKEMVAGAIQHSGTDLGIAITGIAGPDGGSPEKPVGTVWFAWAKKIDQKKTGNVDIDKNLHIDAICYQFTGNRHNIREQAILTALQGLIERI